MKHRKKRQHHLTNPHHTPKNHEEICEDIPQRRGLTLCAARSYPREYPVTSCWLWQWWHRQQGFKPGQPQHRGPTSQVSWPKMSSSPRRYFQGVLCVGTARLCTAQRAVSLLWPWGGYPNNNVYVCVCLGVKLQRTEEEKVENGWQGCSKYGWVTSGAEQSTG